MTDDVKRRPYRSERRREQAEQTRTRVLAAARDLFVTRGYDGTSIAAVARAAGVAEETVYAHFRNKRTLVGELLQRAVRGDDERPVLEQAAPRAVAALADQREQLRIFGDDVVRRLERAAPLVAVVAAAARTEPELAALYERLHDDRRAGFARFVRALAANGPLRLSEAEAIDTVWTLASPELQQLLTRVRGWKRARYRRWLVERLTEALLD